VSAPFAFVWWTNYAHKSHIREGPSAAAGSNKLPGRRRSGSGAWLMFAPEGADGVIDFERS